MSHIFQDAIFSVRQLKKMQNAKKSNVILNKNLIKNWNAPVYEILNKLQV
jgi:hypothetical protein